MNRSTWPMLAMLTMVFAIPASAEDRDIPAGGLARNEAECVAQFQAADLNGDGILNRRELSESRSLVPTQLSGEEWISRHQFLTVCNVSLDAGRGG